MSRTSTDSDQPGSFASRGGRLLLIGLATALLAFAVGYLFTALAFFRGGPGDVVATVPDLRQQSEAEARRLANAADLQLEVGASLVNPEVPEGRVIAQSPLPGHEVSPGSPLRIVLSAGRERRTVPDVSAMGGDQARLLLSRSGFNVQVEERTDPAPAGRVLDVSPAVGATVEIPASVVLVVSAGPPLVSVPEVLGMPREQAREALAAAELAVGEIGFDPFSPFPAGTVVAQLPGAGARVPIGSAVSITVAGASPWNL